MTLVLIFSSTHLFAGTAVTYSVDGHDYEGYAKKAEGTAKGTVVMIHDWDGLTEYEMKRAQMLSDLGYNTFAIDVYGKGNRPTEVADKKAATKALYSDREKMRALTLGGLNEAKNHFDGKMIVMGYCFGGAVTLELARSGKLEDIAGFASFHGGLKTPEGQSYSANKAPIFIAHGGADESVKMADVAALAEELEAARVSYEIEVYSGAPHAFTVFGSNRYRETADKKSWAAFNDFLVETLDQ